MDEKTRIYKLNKLKNILSLLLCLVFLVIGFLMIANDEIFKGWLVTVIFALGTLVFVINLLPNASYLKLGTEGFEVRSMFRSSFTKWTDVKNFRIGNLNGNKMVFFDFEKEHTKWETGKKVARFLSGKEGVIPSSYTISPENLLQLMEEYKTQSE